MTNTAKVEFGTYVQVHEKHNNSMESRTSGAIALRPSGNEQGGHYFLSLHTGKRVLRNHWTVLPMPNDVVDVYIDLQLHHKTKKHNTIHHGAINKGLDNIAQDTRTHHDDSA